MCDSNEDNLPKTQKELAAHIGLETDRSVREICTRLGLDSKTISQRDFRLAYIKDQRETAAGRGGDQASSLAKARTRESQVNTMCKELQLAKDSDVVVESEVYERELEQAITASRQMLLSISEGLKTEIDARYGIDLDASIIDESIYSALSELAGYDSEREAANIEGVEALVAAAEDVDAGVVE